MLHVAPDLSGVIPLNAFEAQAAGVRNLAAGAMDLAGTAGAALKEMQGGGGDGGGESRTACPTLSKR